MKQAEQLRLIDAHCHVNFRAYRSDREAVVDRALRQGIGMINVGSQKDTSQSAVDLAKRYPGTWAIIGLHPIHLFKSHVDEEEDAFLSRAETFDADRYRRLVEEGGGKVVAIGETGLDYFHLPEGIALDKFVSRQKAVFQEQLELARELDLPLMVHSREPGPDLAGQLPSAHDDILDIIESNQRGGHAVRGNVHCFGGTMDQADRYLRAGFHISFTGIITFPPRKRDLAAGLPTAQDLVRELPLDRLLVETDAPYLAPVPHRGERNEPANVRFIAEELAKIKGIPVEEAMAATLENTRRLFNLW